MATHKRAPVRVEEDYAEDRTLDRLVDVGGLGLPAYPDHPLRCLARIERRVNREADRAQSRQWQEAGGLNGAGRARREWAEFDDAYARGWHPLAQVHPDDRPSLEISRDFHGRLQVWLAEHLPFLTLEACARTPARRPAGKRLHVPGNGEVWTTGEGEVDA